MEVKQDKINTVLSKVKEKYPENKILLIYLTGSRFYGYNREDSDYDFIVYIMPTERELFFGNEISTELKINENLIDSVKVRDIRLIVKDISKPNISTLPLMGEPVFSNMKSDKFVENIKMMADYSIHENKKQIGMSLLGAVRNTQKEKRVILTMFLLTLSSILYNGVRLDLGTIDYVAKSMQIAYSENDLPDNFQIREKELFQKWKDMNVKPVQLDYEGIFLEGYKHIE